MGIEDSLTKTIPQDKDHSDFHVAHKIQDIDLKAVSTFTNRVQAITQGITDKPSEERISEIQNTLKEVSDLFDGSVIPYTIDGALNISLYKKEFFRDHRDVDISVFSTDIPSLARLLEKKGYALFRFPLDVDTSAAEHGVLRHELLDPEKIDIETVSRDRLLFLRVNHELEILLDEYVWFDVHAIDRNENGDVIQLNGTVIPKKYTEALVHVLNNGKEIQLCHPAVLAYHKLLSGREYPDFGDLVMLKEFVHTEDFAAIKSWLESDLQSGWSGYETKATKALQWLEKLTSI